MPQENKAHAAFKSLLNRIARVPKEEIDRREKEARQKPSKPAKPGQIVPTPEPHSR